MLIIHISSPNRVFAFDLRTSGLLTSSVGSPVVSATTAGVSAEEVERRISEAVEPLYRSDPSAEVENFVQVGQPLYLLPNGHLSLAQANAIATAQVCGLALNDALPTFAAIYSNDGTVKRDNWTPIVGTVDLLPGAIYYLSPELPGQLTAIAPTESGQIVVAVGIALNSRQLAIEVQPPILL